MAWEVKKPWSSRPGMHLWAQYLCSCCPIGRSHTPSLWKLSVCAYVFESFCPFWPSLRGKRSCNVHWPSEQLVGTCLTLGTWCFPTYLYSCVMDPFDEIGVEGDCGAIWWFWVVCPLYYDGFLSWSYRICPYDVPWRVLSPLDPEGQSGAIYLFPTFFPLLPLLLISS